MYKAILIDPKNQTVTDIEVDSENPEKTLHAIIGGWLTIAFDWSNGDVLYVDDEGLLKDSNYFFRITDFPHQPLAGRGVVVGREMDESSESYPTTYTKEDILLRVMWLGRGNIE